MKSDPKVGWPKCGEIDIMELIGREPGMIHGTVHRDKDGKDMGEGKATAIDHPENTFHVYAVNWTPDRIDFFVDDKKLLQLRREQGGGKWTESVS